MRISIVYLYLIRNFVNGKGYIGITKQKPYRRWSAHHRRALLGKENFAISRAIRKHGLNAFTFTILAEAATWDELVQMEQRAIQEYQTSALTGHGYNLTLGGEGAPGVVKSPELRARMSIARKASGFRLSEEALRRMAESKRGKPSSPAQKAATSKRFAGIPKTEEHRRRISDGLKGRKISVESRQKMSAARMGVSPWNKGKPMLPHVKEILRQARTNSIPWNKGQSPSAEVRQKLSAAGLQAKNAMRKQIEVDGVIYNSIMEAARMIGCTVDKLRWALKTGKAVFVNGDLREAL